MNLELLCKNAAAVKYEMQTLSAGQKNQVLLQSAETLIAEQEKILSANK